MEPDPNPIEPPAVSDRPSRTTKWVAGAAIVGALLGSAGVAVAQTGDGSNSDPSTSQAAPDPTQSHHSANGITEELLTGETATKVSDAAKAEVPDGTIERVETDAEGDAYEAHVVKADGTHVTVKVDESFNVTGVESGPSGPGGRGAPPGATSGTQ